MRVPITIQIICKFLDTNAYITQVRSRIAGVPMNHYMTTIVHIKASLSLVHSGLYVVRQGVKKRKTWHLGGREELCAPYISSTTGTVGKILIYYETKLPSLLLFGPHLSHQYNGILCQVF
jgi:hypothetical protein